MNFPVTRLAVSAAALVAFLIPSAAMADVTVLTAGAMFEGGKDLAAAYTKETGVKVSITSGAGGVVRDKVKAGEKIDLVILPGAGMDELIKQNLVKPGTTVVGRATLALAVHKGAPIPDISTPEKYLAALKAASSVAYTDPAGGSTFGLIVDKLLQRPEYSGVKAKKVATGATPAMAKGEAEMAFQPVSEILPVEGASLAGRVPASLGAHVDYYASLSATAASPKEAEAFLKYMTGPAVQHVWREKGVDEAKGD